MEYASEKKMRKTAILSLLAVIILVSFGMRHYGRGMTTGGLKA